MDTKQAESTVKIAHALMDDARKGLNRTVAKLGQAPKYDSIGYGSWVEELRACIASQVLTDSRLDIQLSNHD